MTSLPRSGEGQAGEAGQGGATPTQRARAMRKSLTPQEAHLWGALKRLRADGYHVRRQTPFRGYFLDFVCHARRLVIEVDGGQHADDAQARHDAIRDAVLAREGYTTLRVSNAQVNTNFGGVMETILAALASGPTGASPTLAASPPVPPHEGEGGGS